MPHPVYNMSSVLQELRFQNFQMLNFVYKMKQKI